jgi:hypothetical protein
LFGIKDVEFDTKNENFEVYEENVETVSTFMRLQTQWKILAMGGFIGLDYIAVEAVFRMTNIKDHDIMLSNIQTMEGAALSILNNRK